MAEVLGIVASSISIAELALGIAKTGVKIADLIKDVRELPDELRHRLELLSINSSILEHLSQLGVRDRQHNHPSLQEARAFSERCSFELKSLYCELIDQLDHCNKFRRAARLSKIVLKKDFVSKVELRLSKSLECLSLANQAYFRYVMVHPIIGHLCQVIVSAEKVERSL